MLVWKGARSSNEKTDCFIMYLNFTDDNKLNITLNHTSTTLKDLKIRTSNYETHKLEFLHDIEENYKVLEISSVHSLKIHFDQSKNFEMDY